LISRLTAPGVNEPSCSVAHTSTISESPSTLSKRRDVATGYPISHRMRNRLLDKSIDGISQLQGIKKAGTAFNLALAALIPTDPDAQLYPKSDGRKRRL